MLSIQYDETRQLVNIAMGGTDPEQEKQVEDALSVSVWGRLKISSLSSWVFEVVQLSWPSQNATHDQIKPIFERASSYTCPRDGSMGLEILITRLSGDHVAIHDNKKIYLWNWRENTAGAIRFKEEDSPHRVSKIDCPLIIRSG